jgi:hypothetical protein
MIPGPPLPKNYEAQLTTNLMFKDEIDFFLKQKIKNYN